MLIYFTIVMCMHLINPRRQKYEDDELGLQRPRDDFLNIR